MIAEFPRLTERQRRFCDAFLETGNAMQAGRIAGYRNTTSFPYKTLQLPYIQSYLETHKSKLSPHSKNRILANMEKLANDEKVKPTDRIAADALICKIQGFTRETPVQQVSIVQLLSQSGLVKSYNPVPGQAQPSSNLLQDNNLHNDTSHNNCYVNNKETPAPGQAMPTPPDGSQYNHIPSPQNAQQNLNSMQKVQDTDKETAK